MNVKLLSCPPVGPVGVRGAGSVDHIKDAIGYSVTHALLVILIILVTILVIVLLVLNRDRVRSNVQPLIANFRKSMEYRTIEKDTEPPAEVNV